MSYHDVVAEHQRLCLLRALAESPSYSANDSILKDSLGVYGLDASRDQVRGHLHWLQEQGLVTLEALSASVTIARVTERGLDVANGFAQMPGVKRPGPRA